MDNILDDVYEEFQVLKIRLLDVNEKVKKIYADLGNQRNIAKSEVLINLLNAEINAYDELNVAFDKYMKAQAAFIERSNDRLRRVIDSTTMADINFIEKMYILNDMLPVKDTFIMYMNAVSRESKDWMKIKKMLLEFGINITIGNIPVISNIKSLVDMAIQIKDIVEEFNNERTDYSKIDQELSKVEIHTELMKNISQIFLYQADIVSNGKKSHYINTKSSN